MLMFLYHEVYKTLKRLKNLQKVKSELIVYCLFNKNDI